MSPGPTSSVKFTYEDFANFPDDGKRHEIIDGEHYVTPSPSTKHQDVSACLTALLWTYLLDWSVSLSEVFASPF